MSLEEYEHFVFRACHVEGSEDPIGHWNGVGAELRRRAEALSEAREIRIVGPDTDLRLGVEGGRGSPRRRATTCPTARSIPARWRR